MNENTAIVFLVIGSFVVCIGYVIVLPMFNAYLEYKLRLQEIEDNRKWNEEGLQRNNDNPDIKQRSGKSDEGTFLHDEELPL